MFVVVGVSVAFCDKTVRVLVGLCYTSVRVIRISVFLYKALYQNPIQCFMRS